MAKDSEAARVAATHARNNALSPTGHIASVHARNNGPLSDPRNPAVGEPKGPPLTSDETWVQQQQATLAKAAQQDRKNQQREIANIRKNR